MVERNGVLIMVDDDRMPLADSEEPRMEMVRSPNTWLLSAHRSDPFGSEDIDRDYRRDAVIYLHPAPRPGY